MILDDRSELCTAFSAAASVGTTHIGDVLDLGPTPYTPELFLVIIVLTAFASSGAASVSFQLVSDAQAGIATDGSATQLFGTGPLPFATLTAGVRAACVPLPIAPPCERYLGLLLTVATAPISAGKFSAFLTNDPSVVENYAAAMGR